VEEYVRRDSRNMNEIQELTYRCGGMRNVYARLAGKSFDLQHENYSLGVKEFEIQRVYVLKRNQFDFVMIDDASNPTRPSRQQRTNGGSSDLEKLEDLFQTTSV
jgi:hypothetical protein